MIPQDITSLGSVVGQLQKPLKLIEMAVVEGNILPRMRINGVPYFDPTSIERIRARIAAHESGERPLVISPHYCAIPMYQLR